MSGPSSVRSKYRGVEERTQSVDYSHDGDTECTLCDGSSLWCSDCHGELKLTACVCPEGPYACPSCEAIAKDLQAEELRRPDEEAAIECIETMTIKVSRLHPTWEELVRAAEESRDPNGHPASEVSAIRLSNYIRHELTDYDAWSEAVRGLPRAHALLRERVMEAVDEYIDEMAFSASDDEECKDT